MRISSWKILWLLMFYFLYFRGLSNWFILDWLIGLEKKKGINKWMGPWSICLLSMLKERIVEHIGMFGLLAYWHIRWRLGNIPLMGSRKIKNGLNWSRYFLLNSEFSWHLQQRTWIAAKDYGVSSWKSTVASKRNISALLNTLECLAIAWAPIFLSLLSILPWYASQCCFHKYWHLW